MKALILVLFLFVSTGCELHKQEVFSKGKLKNSKFQLEALEKMLTYVISDNYFALEEALKDEMDLNVLNKQGQSLLIEAIKLKRDLITKLFLEKGADPQFSDSSNQTAFDTIESFEDKEFWQGLLEGNGLPNEYLDKRVVQLVSDSAQDTQDEVAKKLKLYFASGANVNARNRRKYTLLILAASKNLPELVTFLCETKGVDIKAKAGRYTALSLTKRLMRRNPDLKRIVDILNFYLNRQ